MQINKKIRSGNKEVDLYIDQLEGFLTQLDANNVYRMLVEIDNNAGVIADDIRLLATIDDDERLEGELKLLGSRKNKRFEAFLALVKQVKDFGTVSTMIKEMRAKNGAKEVEEVTAQGDLLPQKKFNNIQDLALNSQQ